MRVHVRREPIVRTWHDSEMDGRMDGWADEVK